MTVGSTDRGAAGGLSSWMANVRRIGGIAGIIYIVLFVVGVMVQGDTPAVDEDAAGVREFFTDGDKANLFLLGDWLVGVGFLVFFVPFLSALRNVLAGGDPAGGMWARAAFGGGIVLLAAGLTASLGFGSLALTGAEGMDDGTLLFANGIDAYGFGVGVPMAVAAFLAPASLVIAASGVVWRWLGWAGLVIALLNLVGALWVLGGEQDTPFGAVGLVALPGYTLWVLVTSIALLVKRREATVVQPSPAFP